MFIENGKGKRGIVKQKILFLLLCTLLVFSSVSCNQKREKMNDFTGTWESEREDDIHIEAIISNDTVRVNWVTGKDHTKAIYWIGTYISPSQPVFEYEWTSLRDKEKTKTSLLASYDESKVFKYSNGTLLFDIITSQSTSTVKLTKK